MICEILDVDGNVVNTIVAKDFAEVDAIYPGKCRIVPDPITPAPAASWPAYEFYRRFTSAERIAIRALADVDPIEYDFLRTLEHAISSNSSVMSNDPDLIAGLAYLESHPIGSPCLSMGRAAIILSP